MSVSAGPYAAPPRGRAEHDRDLRHLSGGPHHRGEHLADAVERVHALAEPGAAGVPHPEDGHALGHGEVDGLDDAQAALGAHRAAHPGGVGGERHRRAAVDETAGGDHAVGVTRGQPHEGGGVEERVQADARIYHVTGSSCTPYTNMSYLNGTFSTGTASRRDGIRRNSVSQTTCSCTLASSWPMHW